MAVSLARRRGTQVAHSLNVIAELPSYVDDSNVPTVLRVAAIDGFFVHLRLVIEFLTKRPGSGRYRAITWHDYTRDFHLDEALRRRLSADYDFASRYVAHLNVDRVPTSDSPIFETVDAARLRGHADDVFAAMKGLAQHMATAGDACASDFQRWLAEAEARRDSSPSAEVKARDVAARAAGPAGPVRRLVRRLRSPGRAARSPT